MPSSELWKGFECPIPCRGSVNLFGLDVGVRGIKAGSEVLEAQGLADLGQAACGAGQPGGVINGYVDAHARGSEQVAGAPNS